jgi:hypothetical protein
MITLNTYSHTNTDAEQRANAVLADALYGKEEPPQDSDTSKKA